MIRLARRGFTLTELLVVIAIIGMLMALVVPAVMSARARAQVTQCMNNQKEIATAIQQYEGAKQHYPGWQETISVGTNRSYVNVPWAAVILEYLGRRDLWTARFNEPAVNPITGTPTTVVQLRCPSSASVNMWPLSYAANCGLPDVSTSRNPPDSPSNGVFHDHRRNLPLARQVMMSSSDIRDGTSHTILFSENNQAYQWANPTSDSFVLEWQVGLIWQPTLTALRINQDRSSMSIDLDHARPSSNHSGGVVAAFCDGHQSFLRDTIAYPILVQLMTPDGQRVTKAGDSVNSGSLVSVLAGLGIDWVRPLSEDDLKIE